MTNSASSSSASPLTESPSLDREVGVAILGMGTVGSEVVRLLGVHQCSFTHRIGAPIAIRGIAVQHPDRHPEVDPGLLTTDAQALIDRDDVEVVVEVMGGIDNPRKLLLSALKQGKSVVTANKAVIALYTDELSAAAESTGADLYFEAAVAGAIPVIGPLRRSLAGDEIIRIMGVVNGTTNFMLSAMDETGADYDEALAEAGRLGYAEADPSADVEGYDAASKAAILASMAFHTRVTADDVHREGIVNVTADDIANAKSIGCTIKLLAICERLTREDGTEAISARVYPALVQLRHPLASVNGAYNAIFVDAEAAGQLMFYGPGAGGAPTASAVLGDVVAAARNKVHGGRAPGESTYAALPIAPFGEIHTRYLINMRVSDRAGVLASVAKIFAAHGVSISTVRQRDSHENTGSPSDPLGAKLMLVTHSATEAALEETVEELALSDAVLAITSVLRMEGVEV